MANAILHPDTPGVAIPDPTPRYRTDPTVPDLEIMDTTAKDASTAVNQFINTETAYLIIVVRA